MVVEQQFIGHYVPRLASTRLNVLLVIDQRNRTLGKSYKSFKIRNIHTVSIKFFTRIVIFPNTIQPVREEWIISLLYFLYFSLGSVSLFGCGCQVPPHQSVVLQTDPNKQDVVSDPPQPCFTTSLNSFPRTELSFFPSFTS